MRLAQYPALKDSGIAHLGNVPAHWCVIRLRFVADLNPSKAESREFDRTTLVTFVPMEAVGADGTLSLDIERPISEIESGYTFFAEGDVAIAKITPCYENGKGAVMRGLLNGIGFGTTELIVARPRTGMIVASYLHYLFVSSVFRVLGESYMYGAGGQKRVPDDFVRNFVAAVPSVSEQAAIAAFLDRETAKIDALVAAQQRMVALLKEKRQAVISHAVTKGLNHDAPMKASGVEWLGDVPAHWDAMPLKHFAAIDNSGCFGEEPVGALEVLPVATTAQIDSLGRFAVEKMPLRGFTSEQLARYACSTSDILVVKSSGSADNIISGKAGLVDDSTASFVFSNFLMRVRPKKSIADARFVFALLRSDLSRQRVQLMCSSTTYPNLKVGQYISSPLPLPPLTEQVLISDFLSVEIVKFDALLSQSERLINLLQERRAALISAAVTGQIDVRGAATEAAS